MWGILLLGMVFITSGLEVQRETIWYPLGKVDVVNELVLVKINTKLIRDKEEDLENL